MDMAPVEMCDRRIEDADIAYLESNIFRKKKTAVIGAGNSALGDALYLADQYWGCVYLNALKTLFVREYKLVTKETLNRLLEA